MSGIFENDIALVAVVIMVRTLFALTRAEFYIHSGDAVAHLAIQNARKNQDIEYPIGFHVFSSILGQTVLRKLPGLFNLLVWSAFIISLNRIIGLNIYSAIYLVMVSLLIDEYNIHYYAYTERLISKIACSIAYGLILAGHAEWSAPIFAWVLCSSKFGRQFFVFIIVPTLLVTKEYESLLYVVLIAFLLVMISGKIRRGIIHQLKWSKNYNKFSTIQMAKKGSPFYEFHMLRILMFPELILVFELNVGAFWVLGVVLIIVSLRRFSFVGESWRYIEWATFLVACACINEGNSYILVIKLVGFYLYQAIVYIKLRVINLPCCRAHAMEVVDFVRGKGAVLPVPYRTGDELMSVESQVDLVAWWPVDGNGVFGRMPVQASARYDRKYLEHAKFIVINKGHLEEVDHQYYGEIMEVSPSFANATYAVIEQEKKN